VLKSDYNLKIHQMCLLFKQPEAVKKGRGRPPKTKLIRKEQPSTARSISASPEEKTPVVSEFSINP